MNDAIYARARTVVFTSATLATGESFAFMRDLGWPWVFDVTHSLQRPSGQGGKSGGTPALAPMRVAPAPTMAQASA